MFKPTRKGRFFFAGAVRRVTPAPGRHRLAVTIPGMELLLVSLASLFAGFVDSIVGGGGLILVPALFAMFPATHPATLFGVNKGASVWGTAAATLQYARRVQMPWHALSVLSVRWRAPGPSP